MADDIVPLLRAAAGLIPGIVWHSHPDCPGALYEGALEEIERLRAELAHGAEMLRIKDDLIDRQIRRILHLEGVRG